MNSIDISNMAVTYKKYIDINIAKGIEMTLIGDNYAYKKLEL